MDKEFVPYTESLSLKELGFDEPCLGWYVSESYGLEYGKVVQSDLLRDAVIAPTFSQCFRFFREKYNILATVYSNASGYLFEWHDAVGGTQRGWSEYKGPNDAGVWDTYEEAELACLRKLIEIVKEKQ